jgi:hypothetical protein
VGVAARLGSFKVGASVGDAKRPAAANPLPGRPRSLEVAAAPLHRPPQRPDRHCCIDADRLSHF